jgi:hypothetical protein
MERKSFAKYKTRELMLPKGRPHCCFENAMTLVLANPKRLTYVEGFYIYGSILGVTFIHHGWVVNKLTGTRHEVTMGDVHPDAVYIGKAFTANPDRWPLLTMQQQYDLLTAAGYDVVLFAERWVNQETPEFGCDACVEVDMNAIDMTLNAEEAGFELMEEGHLDLMEGQGERGVDWHYEWRCPHNPESSRRRRKTA